MSKPKKLNKMAEIQEQIKEIVTPVVTPTPTPTESRSTPIGNPTKELIVSIQPVTPNKGTNAGKQMFLVNGVHWVKSEPKPADTHIVLQVVEVSGKRYTNVAGFSADVRMSIGDKKAFIIGEDPAYSMALASLLR